jgi:hypothetical protein
MRLAALAVALATLSGSLTACSSNSASSGGDDAGVDTSNVVGCDDPKEETYAANMQQSGASGVFNFVLVTSDPAPPANDNNTWVVQLLDASGQPVTDATFTAKATMPTMTHGTTPVTITSNGDGTYTLTPLYFFMAGLWQVAITATSGSQKDTTSFYFCVAG